MPLYKCTDCGALENTALGDYWDAELNKREPKCSECATGKWHGEFPKTPADETHMPGSGGWYVPRPTTLHRG